MHRDASWCIVLWKCRKNMGKTWERHGQRCIVWKAGWSVEKMTNNDKHDNDSKRFRIIHVSTAVAPCCTLLQSSIGALASLNCGHGGSWASWYLLQQSAAEFGELSSAAGSAASSNVTQNAPWHNTNCHHKQYKATIKATIAIQSALNCHRKGQHCATGATHSSALATRHPRHPRHQNAQLGWPCTLSDWGGRGIGGETVTNRRGGTQQWLCGSWIHTWHHGSSAEAPQGGRHWFFILKLCRVMPNVGNVGNVGNACFTFTASRILKDEWMNGPEKQSLEDSRKIQGQSIRIM
jgi:hypothetical protein